MLTALCEISDILRLKDHTARTGKLCEEETFAAEEDVSKAFDRLNFIFYGFLERNDISCINFDHFARCKLFLDNIAVDFEKDHSGTGDGFKDEAFAAKQSGSKFLCEGDIKIYRILCAEECTFLADHAAVFCRVDRKNLTRYS